MGSALQLSYVWNAPADLTVTYSNVAPLRKSSGILVVKLQRSLQDNPPSLK